MQGRGRSSVPHRARAHLPWSAHAGDRNQTHYDRNQTHLPWSAHARSEAPPLAIRLIAIAIRLITIAIRLIYLGLPTQDPKLLLSQTALHLVHLPIVLGDALLLLKGHGRSIRGNQRQSESNQRAIRDQSEAIDETHLERVDRVELALEIREVAPRLHVHRVLDGELTLEALVLVHEGWAHRL